MNQDTHARVQPRKLPLHDYHADRGGRFGQFGDWEVPLYYTSILEEHHAVRTRAGLFDISHMGEFLFEGAGSERFLNDLLPRDVTALKPGAAFYAPMLNAQGGIVDDVILYRFAADHFLLIVNAGNIAKDEAWVLGRPSISDCRFTNISDTKGLLAIQGPASAAILAAVVKDQSIARLKNYHFMEWKSGIVARTGYTGEDGFEVMVDQKDLPELFEELFEKGKSFGLLPAGFGARDTLRLEAGMLLYGHDMDEGVNPYEAGIGWTLSDKPVDFSGKAALSAIKNKPLKRKRIGFEMLDRGIPRQDYEIIIDGKTAGKVTSGSFSPTLQKNIGMGYVDTAVWQEASDIGIQVRQSVLKARVVGLPFYKRK